MTIPNSKRVSLFLLHCLLPQLAHSHWNRNSLDLSLLQGSSLLRLIFIPFFICSKIFLSLWIKSGFFQVFFLKLFLEFLLKFDEGEVVLLKKIVLLVAVLALFIELSLLELISQVIFRLLVRLDDIHEEGVVPVDAVNLLPALGESVEGRRVRDAFWVDLQEELLHREEVIALGVCLPVD